MNKNCSSSINYFTYSILIWLLRINIVGSHFESIMYSNTSLPIIHSDFNQSIFRKIWYKKLIVIFYKMFIHVWIDRWVLQKVHFVSRFFYPMNFGTKFQHSTDIDKQFCFVDLIYLIFYSFFFWMRLKKYYLFGLFNF